MNKEFLDKKQLVDQQIEIAMESAPFKDSPLYPAINYAVTAPGKRIRGVLTLAFCERLSVPLEEALPFAAALELIHAYSLVHDDLPEMDNDDFRRGLPTCHKKFGNAMALLAGDAILNYSIEYILKNKKLYQPNRLLNAIDVLYNASGAEGMLGGQAIDKIGETRQLSLEELLELHNKKTGALLLAPILIANALADKNVQNYVNYSKHIGLAFQIKDDILDIEGSAEKLGKETGKDAEENKSTFVSIMDLDSAKEYLLNELSLATKEAENDPFLLWLVQYIGGRDH